MPTRATCYLLINNGNRLTKGKQVLSLHCTCYITEFNYICNDILQSLPSLSCNDILQNLPLLLPPVNSALHIESAQIKMFDCKKGWFSMYMFVLFYGF